MVFSMVAFSPLDGFLPAAAFANWPAFMIINSHALHDYLEVVSGARLTWVSVHASPLTLIFGQGNKHLSISLSVNKGDNRVS